MRLKPGDPKFQGIREKLRGFPRRSDRLKTAKKRVARQRQVKFVNDVEFRQSPDHSPTPFAVEVLDLIVTYQDVQKFSE